MGELVKLFRGLADLTQRDLAERLPMSESLVGAYERAERIPTTAFLVEAYAALGAKKWSSETVYAITDLPAEQASAAEIASWARGHGRWRTPSTGVGM